MEEKLMNPKDSTTEPKFSYFELQAYWGVRKPHFGGLKATQRLVELCHVNKDKYILDVGCGLGVTPRYIARKYGCRVIGIDISKEMINKARERTKNKQIKGKIEFRVADVQVLPFEDNTFDMIIGESVIAFPEDKLRALKECVRVIKPGGYVGFNEATWNKEPPAEFVEYISRITGAKLETSDNWGKLLESSGLRNVELRIYKLSAVTQFIEEIRYISLKDFVQGWLRFLSLCIRNSDFRKYLKEAWPPKSIFKNYYKYLGYGLYVGKK